MNTPFVSVIIPSYNSKDYIAQCLEKILDQSYPRDRYEVIVVDNGSTDNSPAIIQTYPVKFLTESRKGPSAARNTGIRHAAGEYILFIDTDCMAGKDLIQRHMDAQAYYRKQDPAVRVVGGGIAGINRNFWALCDNYCSWYMNHPKLKPRIEERQHLPTANLSVERTVFETTGLFDENMRFGEDSMFCKMVKQKGYKLYFEPKAVAGHINRTSFQGLMRHAKEWAEIGKYTGPETPQSKTLNLKNPLVLAIYNLYYFGYRFGEIAWSWLSVGDLGFLVCFPVVFVNKLYFGFHMAKSRYAGKKSVKINVSQGGTTAPTCGTMNR